MKKANLISLLSLISLNIVSAYGDLGGSFNNFSFDNFFSNFDLSFLILAVVFLIVFWAFNKITLKTNLIQNNGARITISLILAVFVIYGIIKSNFQIETALFSVGVTQETLTTVLPWLILLIAAIIVWKFNFGALFMIVGAILVGAALLDLVYAKGIIAMVGGIFFLFGLWLFKRKKKESKFSGMNKKDIEDYYIKRSQNRQRRWGHVKKYSGYNLYQPKLQKYREERKEFNKKYRVYKDISKGQKMREKDEEKYKKIVEEANKSKRYQRIYNLKKEK